MNALLNTDALKQWTGYTNLRDLTRFLNRMSIPYAQCGEAHIVSTLASVQAAFDAKEVNESVEIIRVDEVIKLTKLSRSTIHLHMKKGLFPSSKQLGPKLVGWYKRDVLQWEEGKRVWIFSGCSRIILPCRSIQSIGFCLCYFNQSTIN